MRPATLSLLFAFTLSSMAGCSDDSAPARDSRALDRGVADQRAVPREASIPGEASAPREASAPKEVGAGGDLLPGKSCKQIYECVLACDVDTTCAAACPNQGCASAKSGFDTLWTCALDSNGCWSMCPGPKCDGCLKSACTTAYESCNKHSCP